MGARGIGWPRQRRLQGWLGSEGVARLGSLARTAEHSRVHGHGGEPGVEVFAGRLARVAREQLRRVELVLAAELLRRQAVVLPHLVQVRLGRDQHARRLAVHEVLLPSTKQSGVSGWRAKRVLPLKCTHVHLLRRTL